MKSTIHIFGHDDTFNAKTIHQYIGTDIFDDDFKGRYRHNLKRNDARIIVLSRAGLMYGHFEISGWEEPTARDINEWPPTQRVYSVQKSYTYENPVPLQTVDIFHIHRGKPIDDAKLKEILKFAGNVTPHEPVAV